MTMRYQRIYSQIWYDEKFSALSDDAKLLFIYLLTSPHSNSVGLYVIRMAYMSADLGWTQKRLNEAFESLLLSKLILYDNKASLICIVNQLKHNPIENINQAKAASKIVSQLPKSSLYSVILEQLNKPFHEPLRKALQERFAEQIPEPETKTKTETETKTEEKEIVPHDEDRAGPAPSKAVIFIPVKGKKEKEYPITEGMVAEFRSLFPAVDIVQELKKIRAWNIANPDRQKTPVGVMRHVTRWLSKAQDSANGKRMNGESAGGLSEWLNRKKQENQENGDDEDDVPDYLGEEDL